MQLIGRKYTFYISITALLVTTVIILATLFLWINYRESKTAAIQTAGNFFSEINTKTIERYENALESVSLVAALATRIPGIYIPPSIESTSHSSLEYMIEALSEKDYIYSTYVGYKNGSFIQIIAMRGNHDLMAAFDAPVDTAFVLRIIAPDYEKKLKQTWYFISNNGLYTKRSNSLDPNYDPRKRIWYQQALVRNSTFFTEPYVFSSYKVSGITCAKRLSNSEGVFGVDITLNRFSHSLEQQQVSENGLLFLFNRSAKIIANPKEDPVQINEDGTLKLLDGRLSKIPSVRAIVDEFRRHGEDILNQNRELMIDGKTYLLLLTGVQEDLKFDQILASVAPLTDFTQHIRRMQNRVVLLCGLVLMVVLPFALFVSRMISSSLTQLEQESKKIQQRDFSESPFFDSNIKEIHSLIKTFRLMKKNIRNLLDQQRKLFVDFTKLIAGAIDAKSPYTGGHCARVPIIAEMMMQAACRVDEGPFANFDINTADQHWEFEVAAWLHDCGKVTTPDYVVDKATKLETIYNRIHEIRMRFEVLLRDAEIDYLSKCIEGSQDEASLREKLEREKKLIIEDFEFVATCNVGGEFMADESLERLQKIASRTWVRYLDDRIGISQDEAILKNQYPPQGLPANENVLADKYWHIIPRNEGNSSHQQLIGFNMSVPENLYNRGELYNLTIRKGTLSVEDRYKIQEHIVQTILMLSKLEFPEYLANVPEYAGAHHETMIGTGYPKGLKKEEMSIPARIMAIADIFEALTAADRPYKAAKTLSETLQIMSSMSKEQHIDGELFELFLRSGVFQEYANRYLDPAQMDDINVEHYL
jgi:HD-GYP domain-containing protein (c-di-GMP phosphodiesterase class II)